MNRFYLWLAFIFVVFSQSACTDNAVVDTNIQVEHRNWTYLQKIKVPVKIENTGQGYNIYMNLRHTADYKYSNIFVLVHQSGPGMKAVTERREFKLAYPDGEWLGSGSGNFYSYQLLLKKDYRFPAAGTYVFEFEQNMRDNPLREVSDVGLRVEPARP